MQCRVTPTQGLGGCWGGGTEVGFHPARGWRRRFWFTNILQMGQWAVFKPLPVAVSPRDGVLGVPRLVGGGRRDVRNLFPSAVASIGKGWDLGTSLAGKEQ